MTIRGSRNPMPTKGAAPTGIFSTNGKQKKDAVIPLPSKAVSVQKYALRDGTDKAGELSGAVNKNLRHQPPRKR
jgi:hypothetical protein